MDTRHEEEWTYRHIEREDERRLKNEEISFDKIKFPSVPDVKLPTRCLNVDLLIGGFRHVR